MKHLFPRYDPMSVEPFTSAKEMIEYLSAIYTDPYRVENARYTYDKLVMGGSQPFYEFKTQFLHLANEAQIPPTERFSHLYNKVTPVLRNRLLTLKYTLGGDFQKLCEVATGLDTDLKREATRRKEEKKLSLPTIPSTISSVSRIIVNPSITDRNITPRAATPLATKSESRETPAIESPPDNSIKCFNCGRYGYISYTCVHPKLVTHLKDIEEEIADNEEPENEDA